VISVQSIDLPIVVVPHVKLEFCSFLLLNASKPLVLDVSTRFWNFFWSFLLWQMFPITSPSQSDAYDFSSCRVRLLYP
jgi:hypothetical protein